MTDIKSQGTGLTPNVAATLSYLFFTGIVFLVIEKENKEVRFHAWQSTILFAALICYIVLATILMHIPIVYYIVGFVSYLIYFTFAVVVILCMVKAFQGGRMILPMISEMAEKQVNK